MKDTGFGKVKDKTYYIPAVIFAAANLLHLFFTYLSLSGEPVEGALAICVFVLFHASFVYLGIIPTIVFLITIRKAKRAVLATLIFAGIYVLQIYLFYLGMTLN